MHRNIYYDEESYFYQKYMRKKGFESQIAYLKIEKGTEM